MANTYTQFHMQFVFAVKYRDGLIHPSWEDELYKYITGIVQNYDNKMLAINGMPDHVHLFIGMRAIQSPSKLMQDVKKSSSEWINENKLTRNRFQWQEGFGGFSYGRSQVKSVIKYILNQKQHHSKKTFREEYLQLLRIFEIEFDERYIFTEPE